LFYRTLNGARVGDLFMSLIHTAELHQIEPFDYLVTLQRHVATVALDPSAWMPWNYTEALARAEAPPPTRLKRRRTESHSGRVSPLFLLARASSRS
jgi:hypothetical protein